MSTKLESKNKGDSKERGFDFSQPFELADVYEEKDDFSPYDEVVDLGDISVKKQKKREKVITLQRRNPLLRWIAVTTLLMGIVVLGSAGLIQWNSRSLAQADAQREQRVAGVKANKKSRIVGFAYSVELEQEIEKDFALRQPVTVSLEGFERQFQKTGILAIQKNNGIDFLSGIEVYSQESTSKTTQQELETLLKKQFAPETIYQYPAVQSENAKLLRIDVKQNLLQNNLLESRVLNYPTVWYLITAENVFLIKQYDDLPELQNSSKALIQGFIGN